MMVQFQPGWLDAPAVADACPAATNPFGPASPPPPRPRLGAQPTNNLVKHFPFCSRYAVRFRQHTRLALFLAADFLFFFILIFILVFIEIFIVVEILEVLII